MEWTPSAAAEGTLVVVREAVEIVPSEPGVNGVSGL
jgi:hypothetical protein